MSYQSFSTEFEIDIVENGRSILTTTCTAEYYDSDILDCPELDLSFGDEITDDALSDAIEDSLTDLLNKKSAKEWDALHGEVIQLNYNSETETATLEN